VMRPMTELDACSPGRRGSLCSAPRCAPIITWLERRHCCVVAQQFEVAGQIAREQVGLWMPIIEPEVLDHRAGQDRGGSHPL